MSSGLILMLLTF